MKTYNQFIKEAFINTGKDILESVSSSALKHAKSAGYSLHGEPKISNIGTSYKMKHPSGHSLTIHHSEKGVSWSHTHSNGSRKSGNDHDSLRNHISDLDESSKPKMSEKELYAIKHGYNQHGNDSYKHPTTGHTIKIKKNVKEADNEAPKLAEKPKPVEKEKGGNAAWNSNERMPWPKDYFRGKGSKSSISGFSEEVEVKVGDRVKTKDGDVGYITHKVSSSKVFVASKKDGKVGGHHNISDLKPHSASYYAEGILDVFKKKAKSPTTSATPKTVEGPKTRAYRTHDDMDPESVPVFKPSWQKMKSEDAPTPIGHNPYKKKNKPPVKKIN